MADLEKNVPALVPGEVFRPASVPQPVVDEATQRLRQEALPSVVRILNPSDRSSGTGFYLDAKGLLATDAHVVLNSTELFARRADGKDQKVEIVDLDDTRDVALVRTLNPTEAKAIPVGDSASLKPGEKLCGVGHPLSVEEKYAIPASFRQRVTALDALKPAIPAQVHEQLGSVFNAGNGPVKLRTFFTRPLLETDGHVEKGASGGPLLNGEGKVVGLVEMHHNNKIAYFNPIEAVTQLRDGERKFKVVYEDQAEPWAEAKREQWKSQPLGTVAVDALRGIGATARDMQSIKEANPWASFGSIVNGQKPNPDDLRSGLNAGLYLEKDYTAFATRADGIDRVKYGLQAAGDLAGAVGATTISALHDRRHGMPLLAAGAAIRYGAGFIRNRHVLTSLKGTDDGMPPNHFLALPEK